MFRVKSPVRATASVLVLCALVPVLRSQPAPGLSDWTLVGWNDLGMHCMDSRYDVFSILPPFNNVIAQVVDENGDLVDLPDGTTVTYRAIADPSGSINTSSAGKTDFWDHVLALYGAAPPVDTGLTGNSMPGAANTPQPMLFDAVRGWFIGDGVPITPTDDAGRTNHYPMVRLEVRDPGGTVRATTDVVLPVSTEMDCRACHASGAGPAARPVAGWVNDSDYERDYRLNILRLHDELQAGSADWVAALTNFGFNSAGLYETVVTDGRPILCASCHASNALPGTGFGGISPLTAAMHGGHADAVDPFSGMTLDSSANRASCYTCHPGSETRCLRGAMGSAVGADGSAAMQCQSCHGNMSDVGDPLRVGWLQEPACQSCHSGSATNNNGEIRYDTVFEPDGSERVAVSNLFATNPNTPAPGFDLYRFSEGHGGLQCSACHGSTHAIFPSAHASDNLQSQAIQGHVGTLVDCTACHASSPNTVTGGPHGMHPVDASWVRDHHDVANNGNHTQCAACHGADYRGSVLSRAQGDRLFQDEHGPFAFWRGSEIGCFTCHNGPTSGDHTNNHPPVASDAAATTPAFTPVAIALQATDADNHPLELRIVSQPQYGTVSLVGTQATYYPQTGFAGLYSFTFAANDHRNDSNLAVVDVTVTAGWENFGEGYPGTGGVVPELTLGGVPQLGTAVPLRIGNSKPSNSLVFLLASDRPDYQPTPLGGQILVADPGQRTFVLPPQGWNRLYHVPTNPALVGKNVVLQTMVRDAGATNGFAFSRGLRMVYGN